MILKNLSAWITNSKGEQLDEFERVEVSENTVECWISSVEGENFRIRWQPIRNFEPDLGLRCKVKLDGRAVSSGTLFAKDIARGIPGRKTGMTVGPGQKRYFVFGSQKLTDNDELASPDAQISDLGTIRVTLVWTSCLTLPRGKKRTYVTPQEPGFIHERAAKKGHASAVGLGEVVSRQRKLKRTRNIKLVDAGLAPMVFIFRYAPRDWLKAQGIIPEPSYPQLKSTRQTSPSFKRKRSPSQGVSSRKRIRDYDPSEVIDIDDLETDNDSDVVVLNDSEEPAPVKVEKTDTRLLSVG